MEIISLKFLFFVILAVCGYHLLPSRHKKVWLLEISILFYLFLDFRFVLILAFFVLSNYFLAKLKARGVSSRTVLWLTLILDIGAFILLKFITGRYIGLVSEAAGSFFEKWVLPVGFSYYMLQLISFQIDLNKGRFKDLPSLLDFAVYLFYFPKLLSGPIEKPKDFLARLALPKVVDNAMLETAFGLIFMGLIRKLFIANTLFPYLPDWNGDVSQVGWSHVIGFVLYVYNDFAGYSLIVRGVSCLFGIELSPNFWQPLLSRNFSDFWNRWHITLSTWLRENIFFPLSRKLRKNSQANLSILRAFIIPPILTLIVSGLWHGASLALVVWGIILGLCMAIEQYLFGSFPKIREFNASRIGSVFSTVLVIILFSFAMVPLATNVVKVSINIWKNLLSPVGFSMNPAEIPVLSLVAFSFILDIFAQKTGKDLWWQDFNLVPRSAVVAIGMLIIVFSVFLISYRPTAVFIYQGF